MLNYNNPTARVNPNASQRPAPSINSPRPPLMPPQGPLPAKEIFFQSTSEPWFFLLRSLITGLTTGSFLYMAVEAATDLNIMSLGVALGLCGVFIAIVGFFAKKMYKYLSEKNTREVNACRRKTFALIYNTHQLNNRCGEFASYAGKKQDLLTVDEKSALKSVSTEMQYARRLLGISPKGFADEIREKAHEHIARMAQLDALQFIVKDLFYRGYRLSDILLRLKEQKRLEEARRLEALLKQDNIEDKGFEKTLDDEIALTIDSILEKDAYNSLVETEPVKWRAFYFLLEIVNGAAALWGVFTFSAAFTHVTPAIWLQTVIFSTAGGITTGGIGILIGIGIVLILYALAARHGAIVSSVRVSTAELLDQLNNNSTTVETNMLTVSKNYKEKLAEQATNALQQAKSDLLKQQTTAEAEVKNQHTQAVKFYAHAVKFQEHAIVLSKQLQTEQSKNKKLQDEIDTLRESLQNPPDAVLAPSYTIAVSSHRPREAKATEIKGEQASEVKDGEQASLSLSIEQPLQPAKLDPSTLIAADTNETKDIPAKAPSSFLKTLKALFWSPLIPIATPDTQAPNEEKGLAASSHASMFAAHLSQKGDDDDYVSIPKVEEAPTFYKDLMTS